MLSGSGERISGKITRLIQGTTNDGHTEEEWLRNGNTETWKRNRTSGMEGSIGKFCSATETKVSYISEDRSRGSVVAWLGRGSEL